MKYKMVQYTVQPEHKDYVLACIREFVAAVSQHEPGVALYGAFQQPDGNTFTHLIAFENEAAEASHRNAPHTDAFTGKLAPCCLEPPVFTDLKAVASS